MLCELYLNKAFTKKQNKQNKMKPKNPSVRLEIAIDKE